MLICIEFLILFTFRVHTKGSGQHIFNTTSLGFPLALPRPRLAAVVPRPENCYAGAGAARFCPFWMELDTNVSDSPGTGKECGVCRPAEQ